MLLGLSVIDYISKGRTSATFYKSLSSSKRTGAIILFENKASFVLCLTAWYEICDEGAYLPLCLANRIQSRITMSEITTNDNAIIYYKDWGIGRPIVFSHGWPLCSDSWDEQMFFFASRGYRCIAHDRRGHGRSSQPWTGNNMNSYADDLAALVNTLDLKDAVHVGHSTGGGEVARYVARHGASRVAGIVLVGAVTPIMIKSAANPSGVPMQVFDELRAKILADRSQLFQDFTTPFFGTNRPGSSVSQGVLDAFWLQGMQAGVKNLFDCIEAFSQTDQTEDLKNIEVPTLIVHGDEDQVVPIDVTARVGAQLVQGSTLKVYSGAPHALPTTHRDQLNTDILNFVEKNLPPMRL